MASGLNIAAFNVGIAIGSVTGGAIVEQLSLSDTTWIGAIITFSALLLTRISGYLDQREAGSFVPAKA
nr:MFS transporter [Salinimonas profundi]